MAETNENRVQKSGALPSTAKGTTFTISIPIRLQTPPEKEKLENPGSFLRKWQKNCSKNSRCFI